MIGESKLWASVGRFLETFILVPYTVSTKTPCQTRFLFRRIIFRLEKRCRQTIMATGRGKWNDEGNIPPGFLFTTAWKSRLGQGLPRRCRAQLIEERVDKSKSSTPWKKASQHWPFQEIVFEALMKYWPKLMRVWSVINARFLARGEFLSFRILSLCNWFEERWW